MARLSSGDTLRAICEAGGLSSATVRQYVREHPEYHERWRLTREDGAHALVELGFDIIFDSTRSVEERRLIADYIKWVSARYNRADFGDRQQVDIRQAVAYVISPEADRFC